MTILYAFERNRVEDMTEGEHTAPVLVPVSWLDGSKPNQFSDRAVYFYRGVQGQVAGPGTFGKLPREYWLCQTIPVFVLIDPDADYDNYD
jgi:hypothetical protein